ncbi:MAG: pantetheine-phosphate adenylyltransferase [Kiritimatiellae bacterium]|nr:pantetheine-phosphate adenylyltransferase [Kiritimatiellia bacterium]
MNRSAIYAGTFDPITLGHLDLIGRAAAIFPRLILAVAKNPPKRTLFTPEQRAAIAAEAVRELPNVEVELFDGLLVEFARRRGVRVLVRGLRAFSDFEFEFQMALTNRKLAPDIETLFLMPTEEYSYVSSSTVRQIAELGGDVRRFVPHCAWLALQSRLPASRTGGSPQ